METIDILTVAAHPDDIELTCSGTLMKMLDSGYSVGILDLTQGEMGTRGTPEIRAKEAEAARAVIGARFRERLNFGDSRLTASIENRFALAEKIRTARPKTVILPYWEGRHPDHYTAATLGYEACYAAGLIAKGSGRRKFYMLPCTGRFGPRLSLMSAPTSNARYGQLTVLLHNLRVISVILQSFTRPGESSSTGSQPNANTLVI